MRIEGVLGSDPAFEVSLYRPIFGTRVFTRPYAATEKNTIDIMQDDVVGGGVPAAAAVQPARTLESTPRGSPS